MMVPVRSASNGNLRFWAAMCNISPAPKERCWKHKIVEMLEKLPAAAGPGPKATARDHVHAESGKSETSLLARPSTGFDGTDQLPSRREKSPYI
jgi:hypothetical protein